MFTDCHVHTAFSDDSTYPMDQVANIRKRYRELGGDRITIGSDSHAPGQLGAYNEPAKQLLKHLGFQYFCTFDKMQPVYHGL